MTQFLKIIIPIRSNLDITQACLESVMMSLNVNQQDSSIVIINDALPDSDIVNYLQSFQGDKIEVMTNLTPKGYLQSLNQALAKCSDHDVIILDSDTQVYGNWIDRLQQCAYTDDSIGSVTPFTNASVTCGFPHLSLDNKLIYDGDVAYLDQVFAQQPITQFDIPYGIHACIYIKNRLFKHLYPFKEHDVIDEIMGQKQSWKNILCGNVFVYQKGKDHSKLPGFDLKYFYKTHLIQSFVKNDPTLEHRLSVILSYIRYSPLPKILYIHQGLGGGVKQHVNELIHFYHTDAIILVIHPSENYFDLKFDGKIIAKFKTTQQIIQLLEQLNISHVHYHHLMNIPLSLWYLPDKLQCTYDMTLHDYYIVNGNPTLTQGDQFLGHLPANRRDEKSAHDWPVPFNKTVKQWRSIVTQFLENARYVIPVSYGMIQYIKPDYPTITFTPAYPPEYQKLQLAPEPQRLADPQRPLHIVVIGAISPTKGIKIINRVASKADSSLKFTVMGVVSASNKNVTVTGQYEKKHAKQILRELSPDIIWLPSTCAETYSYTLSLAIELGLPVLTFDIGAFQERLQYRKESYLLPLESKDTEIIQWFKSYQQQSPDIPHSKSYPLASDCFFHNTYLQGITPKESQLALSSPTDWSRYLPHFLSIQEAKYKRNTFSAFVAKIKAIPFFSHIVKLLPTPIKHRIIRLITR